MQGFSTETKRNSLKMSVFMFQMKKEQRQQLKSFVYTVSRAYREMTQHPKLQLAVHNVRANQSLSLNSPMIAPHHVSTGNAGRKLKIGGGRLMRRGV